MKEADGPGGFLWKVKHGDTTVYLQGTIHAGPRDFYPMNDEIESIYKEADVIVPEIHPKDMSTQSMMTLYNELGTYQDGTTIEDHIPADLYDDVSAFLNDHGLPSELESYKPWLLSNLISSFIMQEAGYTYGVDDYFLSRAQDDDKEIKALETAEEQLAIFADTSDDFQVELLKSSIEEMDHYEEDMLEMFSLYTDGDLEKMLEYTTTDNDSEMSKEEQAFMNALNDERNDNMSDQIIDYLDSKEDTTYLVIVGSLHLIEKPSIISILEDEGYDVKHIR
nr:TraB/GumN family protein [Virgibacillus sp. MSJ-26]